LIALYHYFSFFVNREYYRIYETARVKAFFADDILFVRRGAPAKWRVSLAGNWPHRVSTNGKRRNHNVLPVRAIKKNK
jgi:hypothetical protein